MAISVVVLAAGLATRYRRPKQLEPLGPHGETLLDYGLHDALEAGVDRVVIVTRAELLPAFQEHLGRCWSHVPVAFALQDTQEDPLRRTPWGTGHAVLASAVEVDGPFVVCNADDFYGRTAWREAVGFIRNRPIETTGRYGVVGYPLATTLSSSGGVSRAVCEVTGRHAVTAVTEWRNIRRAGDRIEAVGLDGARSVLEPEVPVSMNLWGFTADVFPRLQTQFERFRTSIGTDETAEFLLSQAIDEQVRGGEATLHLLPSGDDWFGLTHPADRSGVVGRLRALSDTGEYPPVHCLDSN